MTLNTHASSSRTEERRQTFSWNSTGGENLSNPSIEKDSGLQKARKNSGTTMREKCPRHGCVRSSRVNSGERMILETLPQEDLKENIGDVCFILPTNSQRRVAPPVSIPCTVFKRVYASDFYLISSLSSNRFLPGLSSATSSHRTSSGLSFRFYLLYNFRYEIFIP